MFAARPTIMLSDHFCCHEGMSDVRSAATQYHQSLKYFYQRSNHQVSRHVSRILFWGLSNAEHMHEAALFNNQNMLFKFSSSLYFYGRADIIPRMCVGLTQWRRWLQCAVRSVGYHHSTSSSVSSSHWNQNTKYVWSSFGAKISSKDLSSVSLAWHRPHS